MAGELEEHVLEVRLLSAEAGDMDAMLGQALNHFSDEAIAAPVDLELVSLARDRNDVRQPAKLLLCRRIIGVQHHGSLRTVFVHEALRCIRVDDSSMLDDGDAIA